MKYVMTVLAIVSFVAAASMATGQIPAPVTYRYSLDLGSDWDLSDPTNGEPNLLDCGDIYKEQFLATPVSPPVLPPLLKDDEGPADLHPGHPFTFAPQPTPAQIGSGGSGGGIPPADVLQQYANFWDLDASDQIGITFDPVQGQAVGLTLSAGQLAAAGIHVSPKWIGMSWDDDGAPGWYVNRGTTAMPAADIPTFVRPHHGHGGASQSDAHEVFEATGTFGNWGPVAPPIGTRTEDVMGVPIMNAGDHHDDDVDALDVEDHEYWFFSGDHEANLGLDPGDIYMTHLNSAGQNLFSVIDDLGHIGLTDDNTDVDAWEFAALDRQEFFEQFDRDPEGLAPYYLVGLFSVDQDDPDTLGIDESGGLSPGVIYLTDLAGNYVALMDFSTGPNAGVVEDVDAITVIPEPSSLVLAALGLLGVLGYLYRRTRRKP